MTPTQLRAHLDALDWSQRQLARTLQADDRQVRRWATGDEPIPEPVALWLARLLPLPAWRG